MGWGIIKFDMFWVFHVEKSSVLNALKSLSTYSHSDVLKSFKTPVVIILGRILYVFYI